mmetsp:Transcript_12773/g.20660  ORF Transcript_12773/g.20660 Transcript_12773/m.20660 type:complete len:121 (+) Transcript_12773:270-632(+)
MECLTGRPRSFKMVGPVVTPASSERILYVREHGIQDTLHIPEGCILHGVRTMVLEHTNGQVPVSNFYVPKGSTWSERLECNLFQGNSTDNPLRADMEQALRKGECYRSLRRKLEFVLGVD